MTFLRTNANPEHLRRVRLEQYNRDAVGRRCAWWELGHSVDRLVMKDYTFATPHALHRYISVKMLGFAVRNHGGSPVKRHLTPVHGEECFLIEQEELAMQAFLKRKFSEHPEKESGLGMTREALHAHFNSL